MAGEHGGVHEAPPETGGDIVRGGERNVGGEVVRSGVTGG